MPRRLSPAAEAAQTAARLVFTDTDLTDHGTLMYTAWQTNATKTATPVEELWKQDWKAVLKGFRSTENAVKGLNAMRAEDEEPPLKTEEELAEVFRESEEWTLAFVGNLSGIKIRVWSFDPWDGQLALVVARDEDEQEVATAPTSVA